MRQLLRKEPIVWNGVNHVIRLGDATDISCVLQKIENPSVGFFFKLLLPFIRVFFCFPSPFLNRQRKRFGLQQIKALVISMSTFVYVCVRVFAFFPGKYNLSKCCD